MTKLIKAIVEYNIDLAEAKKDVEELLSKTTSSTDSYAYIHAKITHEDLKKLKRDIDASYRWYQKKRTDLSDLLKELKDECITLHKQLDEQDGEIDRLQEENTYLERQLERAKGRKKI